LGHAAQQPQNTRWVRAKWGPLSSSGREEEAEAEEEGEEEEGSEPAHHSATFPRMGQYVTTRMAV